ncbi:MAG: sigma-70 family RNA polymerase sigma factor [Planctomycetes bacterium]|nr:sigma-70 family RNA polymerase sigma factor [Planctomycetota bacterium]
MPAARTGLPTPPDPARLTALLGTADRDVGPLFAELRRRLLRIVALRTGRDVEALDPEVEDIVQDALLQALQSFDPTRFATGGSVMRWLVTIAMNDVRDRARWRAVRRDLERLRTELASCLRDGAEAGPLANVHRSELERATDAALAALAPEDREALLLRCYEGLDAHELAEALGLRTPEAARARVHRARRRLEARLHRHLDGGD